MFFIRAQHRSRHHLGRSHRVWLPQALDPSPRSLSAIISYGRLWRTAVTSYLGETGEASALSPIRQGAGVAEGDGQWGGGRGRGTNTGTCIDLFILQAAVYVGCLGMMKVVVLLLFWAFPG
jgi:hypothetical protein